MSDETDTTTNNIVSIFNASGVEVYITSPLSTDEAGAGNGLESNYALRELLSGSSTIAPESSVLDYPESEPTDSDYISNLPTTVSDQIEITDTYVDTDSGETEDKTVIDMVCFQNSENWFLPVLNESLNNVGDNWAWHREYYLDSDGLNDYDAPREKVLTIYDTDVTRMTQTKNFLQSVTANPTSKMASDYYDAISNSSYIDDMNDAVAAVTAQYDSYKYVTQDSVVTMQSYFDTVPYVFASQSDVQYYYFYSTSNSSSVFVGRMDFVKGDTISTSAKNGGYTITFYSSTSPTDPSKYDIDTSNGIDITYKDSYFYDDSGSIVYVKGGFILKSLTKTNPDEADYTTIVPCLSGSIHGFSSASAVATDSKKEDPSSSDTEDVGEEWDKMSLLTKLITGFFVSTAVVGILIKALPTKWMWEYPPLRGLKAWKKSINDSMKKKIENQENAGRDVDKAIEGTQKYESKTGNDDAVDWNKITVDGDLDVFSSDLATLGQSITNQYYANSMQNQIETAEASIMELAQTNLTNELESASTSLKDIKGSLEDVDVRTSDAIKTLSDLSTQLKSVAETVSTQSYNSSQIIREQAFSNYTEIQSTSTLIENEINNSTDENADFDSDMTFEATEY
ncbi:MAG: hypothetical protein GY714_32055 [Desulfobacterales bacterium]|nr:hypothetical protein [Desulfobacterales bacterium]